MRNVPLFNFPAFHAAAAKLRKAGHEVWSPAERDEQEGFDPKTDTPQPFRHYMKHDLPAVLESDVIALLPGWEKSVGACLELVVAYIAGIPPFVVGPVDLVAIDARDAFLDALHTLKVRS
jgi:hypothetical protein